MSGLPENASPTVIYNPAKPILNATDSLKEREK